MEPVIIPSLAFLMLSASIIIHHLYVLKKMNELTTRLTFIALNQEAVFKFLQGLRVTAEPISEEEAQRILKKLKEFTAMPRDEEIH